MPNSRIARAAADGAAFEAEDEEMALELAGDETVGGAHIVQDFDDRAVGRHGAARGEGDREHGHGDDQEQDRDAGDGHRRSAMVRMRSIQPR